MLVRQKYEHIRWLIQRPGKDDGGLEFGSGKEKKWMDWRYILDVEFPELADDWI